MLGFVGLRHFDLGLRVVGREDVQVILLDSANGLIENQALRIEQNREVRLTFSMTAATDDRVRVELYPLIETEDTVEPCQLDGYFPVSGLTPIVREPAPERGTPKPVAVSAEPTAIVPAPTSDDWSVNFENTGLVKVFRHIEEHGVIKESELIHLLGNMRKARRFKAHLASHMEHIPFHVKIEMGGSETRYVKGY